METEPATEPRRKFTLLDAMILVAFTAVGCMAYRALDSSLRGGLSRLEILDPLLVLSVVWFGLFIASPIAVGWSAAVVAIRFRRTGRRGESRAGPGATAPRDRRGRRSRRRRLAFRNR